MRRGSAARIRVTVCFSVHGGICSERFGPGRIRPVKTEHGNRALPLWRRLLAPTVPVQAQWGQPSSEMGCGVGFVWPQTDVPVPQIDEQKSPEVVGRRSVVENLEVIKVPRGCGVNFARSTSRTTCRCRRS